jgi:predicted MFS family arabinose efflux permease
VTADASLVETSGQGADSVSAIVTAAYLATVALLIGWFLPFVVDGFASTMGFTERQSGLLVSIDMFGYTVGTIIAAPLLIRISWHRAAFAFLLGIIAANLASCVVRNLPQLLATRGCAGLASGALAAVALGACAQRKNPGSAYGLWQVFQAIAAAGAGFALPGLIEAWTTRVAFVVVAIFAAAGLLLVRFLPAHAVRKVENRSERFVPSRVGGPTLGLAIAAIFLFLTGITAVTAFLAPIGADMHLAPHTVGVAFSIAGVASLLGGVAATRTGDRFGYIGPTALGCLLVSLAYVGYLFANGTAAILIVGTALYYGMYSYVLPYFMGTLAVADPSGRIVALGNAALGAGVTLGPALGGSLLETTGATAQICYVAIGTTVLSFILVLPLQLRTRAVSVTHAA